jgi:hypothetical protein
MSKMRFSYSPYSLCRHCVIASYLVIPRHSIHEKIVEVEGLIFKVDVVASKFRNSFRSFRHHFYSAFGTLFVAIIVDYYRYCWDV